MDGGYDWERKYLEDPEDEREAIRAEASNGRSADPREVSDDSGRVIMAREIPPEATEAPARGTRAYIESLGPAAEPWQSAADIFAPLPPIDWVCRELQFAPGRPIIFGGQWGTGKTIALEDLQICVAAGLPIWGHFEVPHPMVCKHVDLDQGNYPTRARFQRIAQARGIDPGSLQR